MAAGGSRRGCLSPGTKFADIIGEIDPAKLAVAARSTSAEEALHFGLIPRMHRGIFAMNELPELDELVQVGLFNILEERDVQIRGYPIKFDIDVLILFSANPATYNRSGKVIPQLKDRIGTVIHTYPRANATWAFRSWSKRRPWTCCRLFSEALAHDPYEAAAALSPKPVLFCHGGKDQNHPQSRSAEAAAQRLRPGVSGGQLFPAPERPPFPARSRAPPAR